MQRIMYDNYTGTAHTDTEDITIDVRRPHAVENIIVMCRIWEQIYITGEIVKRFYVYYRVSCVTFVDTALATFTLTVIHREIEKKNTL